MPWGKWMRGRSNACKTYTDDCFPKGGCQAGPDGRDPARAWASSGGLTARGFQVRLSVNSVHSL
ncbi:protein of unknown function [Candidatus Methylocalor cossyra]|uniref:Uncharacterized protein n=1 Tax=Candidatus Methylocalor cossyra TaxID=3108543 RepID=A0ABP1C4B2_9GAMM